ncbi:MAG: DNA primase [Gammaproteobacteria bacterium]|nr:DNA primase [Gammaproteobacteria bacterium]
MSRIPQPFIDDVLHRLDIVEIIKARIPLLKKTGSNYMACCPFHQEKSPSFSVHPTKQFYHCFGCGANGNALSFVMQYDRLDFLDALENLACSVGLEIPHTANVNQHPQHQSLISLSREAALFYYQQLKSHPLPIEYVQSRGISKEIIRHFGIGYAPPGWDSLLNNLGQSEEQRQLLLGAGLIIEKSKGKYYDRFRDRLMFPIRNLRGQIIGFGGRTLGDDTPKYLNSPETSLFHKGTELYGLYEARQSNQELDQIIIVEGYMDVVTLTQFGITNAVATLGTATTPQHLQRLFRYTSNVIFCFDGDTAGQNATIRALETALPIIRDGHNVSFIHLPDNEDPDSFIRQYGAGEWAMMIANAKPLPTVLFKHLSQDIDITSIAGKAKFAKDARELLAKMPEGVYQQLLQENLASKIGLTVEALNSPSETKRPATISPPKPEETGIPTHLRNAMSLIIHDPSLASKIELPTKLLSSKIPGVDLLNQLLTICREQPTLLTGALLSYWDENPARTFIGHLASQEPLIPQNAWLEELIGILNRLNDRLMESEINALMQKISSDTMTLEEKQQLIKLLELNKG